jgi:hypothetical protein
MIKVEKYSNMIIAKMRNRRVIIEPLDDHDFGISFLICDGSIQPRALHNVTKNKVVVTSLRLSEEATQALFIALSEYLRK